MTAPQVGDWWMCPGCGFTQQRRHGSGYWHICQTGHCLDVPPDFGTMKPLRLTSEDWLKCQSVPALIAMIVDLRFDVGKAVEIGHSVAQVHCVAGNPFDPFLPDAELLAWRGGTVRAMGSEIAMREAACGRCIAGQVTRWDYERQAEGDKTKTVNCPACKGTSKILRPRKQIDEHLILILADALEEAGCTHAHTLAHLRQSGEHVPQCHVLRALLEVKS